MFRNVLICFMLAGTVLAKGSDYIQVAPATVYEAEEMSPQNMDFDSENNMFTAHSGWYNDKLVHYYKFRMYTPNTYPGVIGNGGSGDAPIQALYIVTETGDLEGAIGNPILQYHTSDTISYSDFMEIHFVTAPENYVANAFKSEGDIMESAANVVPSGIIVNLPVVPTGSTLQDPVKGGTNTAPITHTTTWYKGVEVWTYVFEVTDEKAQDYFAYTRQPGAANDPSYGIIVKEFATSERVRAIPLWHMNQFSRGVTAGVNGGGPSPNGMRNIINLDRPDDAYSPLWAINWVTELPINFLADEASNIADMTSANGFAFATTPMLVNCPDIGPVSSMDVNTRMVESHLTLLDTTNDSNWVLGSHMSLIMQGGVEVLFQTKYGVTIGRTQTNMMGAYEYAIESSKIPVGTTEIRVVANGETIRTIPVHNTAGTEGADYIQQVPATVYEAEEMSPQNMDFDTKNNMFTAHSGWYNDKLVHYYKFRMYTPKTYPGVIATKSSVGSGDVPIQALYIATRTGDLTGAVGHPIVQYHTSDFTSYSDFMEIHFVIVSDSYVANTFKSEGDILASKAEVVPSDIIVNLPVVPTGSTLQDPVKGGISAAPITHTTVWYKGVEVWTYVFEVTDEKAQDYFAYTRESGAVSDPSFGITVTPFATSEGVRAIPLWHVNQFSRGVTAGVNGGGPSPKGMRNIINLDRPDAGYSPLWAINWVTELPINYLADEASNVADMTTENGFAFVSTPMLVNCPDIGPVSSMDVNPSVVEDHLAVLDTTNESNWVLGSHMSLIMQGGIEVFFQVADGTTVGQTETNMMGAYEYPIMSSEIPDGTTEIRVVANGETIRTIPVVDGAPTSNAVASTAGLNALLSIVVCCISWPMIMQALL